MKFHYSSKSLQAFFDAFLSDPITPLARLNVWVKLAIIVIALMIAPFADHALGLLALASLALILLVASKKLMNMISCILGLKYVLAMIVLVTALAEYSRGYSLPVILIDASMICLRLILLLTIFSIISSAFRLKEIIDIADRLRIPRDIAYSFILALRFVPLVLHDMDEVLASLKLKGINLSEGGLSTRIKALKYLLASLVVIINFRRFKVAEAIEIRGLLKEQRD